MKKILAVFAYLLFLTPPNSTAQITIENNKIPPSFANFKGILLIVKAPFKVVNRALENKFEKNYKGEMKFIERENSKKEGIFSTQEYPFTIEIVADGTSNGVSYFKFIMTDRVNGKTYESKSFPDSTIPPYSYISKYAKALEKVRSK